VEVHDPQPVVEAHAVRDAPLGPHPQALDAVLLDPPAAHEDRVAPAAPRLEEVRARRGEPVLDRRHEVA
jgi:hypothetical protein